MNLHIRLATKRDASSMLNIYRYFVEETTVSLEIEVPSETDFANRVESILVHSPWIVCLNNEQVIGYAYAGLHRTRKAYQSTKELSVYIHSDFQRLGIASILYQALIDILKVQGVTNTLIGISLPNDNSVAFHENFGFSLVGIYHHVGIKFNRFVDVGWWEMKISKEPSEKVISYHDRMPDVNQILFNHSQLLSVRS